MFISVIIPCHYEHFDFIPELLKHYNTHTLFPGEIIIVISQANKIKNKIRNAIKNIGGSNFSFKTKWIKLSGKSLAGNSRKIGVKNAKGDIIILQDADDLPHIQRTEIIYNLFKKYRKIVFICHKWTKNGIFRQFDKLHKPNIVFPKINIFRKKRFRKRNHIANGNIAFKKKIVNKIDWFIRLKRRQDIATNISLIDKYKGKYIFIREELLFYRNSNSINKIIKKDDVRGNIKGNIKKKIRIKKNYIKRKNKVKKFNPYKIIINGKTTDIS